MVNDAVPGLLARATERLEEQFAELPRMAGEAEDTARLAAVLARTAERLGDNYPYFHPLYAGQMLKPPHPIARAAYALAMTINPNNHARDGGRASSEMEIEAVGGIAAMFGWREGYLGHLTSSGTIANLEALWVAGQVHGTTEQGSQRTGEQANSGTRERGNRGGPGARRIVGSAQAHYTHQRISAVLQLEYSPVAADDRGRMDLDALETELRRGDVGTVVVTLGTTAMGAVDPLDEIVQLRERYGFRIHVDAAYGGYFKLIPEWLDEPGRRAYEVVHEADSIVVDPHKHGLQPYGCGCVLFKDAGVGRFYKHDSPYTYFTSKELHLGEISLECSRAGAAAVALWTTQQLLPLTPGGEFAQGLAKGRRAALDLYARLQADSRFKGLAGGPPELDIVVWAVQGAGRRASEQAQAIFEACARRNLHLALVQLPQRWFGTWSADEAGGELVTCLRSVLMKPEHEAWLDRIWQEFHGASSEILGE